MPLPQLSRWCLLLALGASVCAVPVFSQDCPDCQPDELSATVRLDVRPTLNVIATADPQCPQEVRGQVSQFVASVGQRQAINNDYVALADAAFGSSAGTNIQFLGPRNAGTATCQNFFVTLPPGSVVTRVVLSA